MRVSVFCFCVWLCGCAGGEDRGSVNTATTAVETNSADVAALATQQGIDPALVEAPSLSGDMQQQISQMDALLQKQMAAIDSANSQFQKLQEQLVTKFHKGCAVQIPIEQMELHLTIQSLEPRFLPASANGAPQRTRLESIYPTETKKGYVVSFGSGLSMEVDELIRKHVFSSFENKRIGDIRYIQIRKKGFHIDRTKYNEDHYQHGLWGNLVGINERWTIQEKDRYKLKSVSLKVKTSSNREFVLYNRADLGVVFQYPQGRWEDFSLPYATLYQDIYNVTDCSS